MKEKVVLALKKFLSRVNNFGSKIDSSINNFRFNVTIAHFYEVYKYMRDNLDNEIGNNLFRKIFKKLWINDPFTPHLTYECLELLNCKDTNSWPKIEKNNLEEIKLAVQVNGKTRDIISIKKDLSEEDVDKIILKDLEAKKYLENGEVKKKIFVRNKIINYIIAK